MPVAEIEAALLLRCAINRAVRLARDPPLVNKPCAFSSYPISDPSQRTTVCSICVADGDERQEVTLAFRVEARRSPKAPTGVDGEATYPKNLGWPLCRLPSITSRQSSIMAWSDAGSLGGGSSNRTLR